MAKNTVREQIGSEIYFTSIEQPKFKSMRISINIITDLSKDTAFENALVINLLRKSGVEYPSFKMLNRRLDDLYGASLYADVMKSADRQIISLSIQSISSKYAAGGEKIENECIGLLMSLLLHPHIENGEFIKENFEIEKNALLEQLLSEMSDKRLYALRETVSHMFENDPHGISVCGELGDEKKTTPRSAYEAYKKLLRESRIEIVCTGNCNTEEICAELKHSFSGVEREPKAEKTTMPLFEVENVNVYEEKQPVLQSKLVLGYSFNSEDLDAVKIGLGLYGGTVTSKLFMNVREKMSLCYYCAARGDNIKKYVLVDSGVSNENVEKAKCEIERQLNLMADGDITDDEMRETLSYMNNGLFSVGDSLSATEHWYMTRIMIGDLMSPEEQSDIFAQVTKERVIEAMKSIRLHTVFVLKGEDEID